MKNDTNSKKEHKEKTSVKKSKKKENEEEISEEDQNLKEELELLTQRLTDINIGIEYYDKNLEILKQFIKESTTSLTAVPKPLKFLKPHFPMLVELYYKWSDKYGKESKIAISLSDMLSVLAMTSSKDRNDETLKYRLLSLNESIGDWGHEYMHHLALEIGESYQSHMNSDKQLIEKLVSLALIITPYFLKNNADSDAVDLLSEIERIDTLSSFVDESNYSRVCLYLVSCVPYLSSSDVTSYLNTAYLIYLSQKEYTNAMNLAIKLDNDSLITKVFDSTNDLLLHKQLGFFLSFYKNSYNYVGPCPEVQDFISNSRLHQYYSYLLKELSLTDPKIPEEIYKSHLENSKYGIVNSSYVDSAKHNLATIFVNAFINLGCCTDSLIQSEDVNQSWAYKTKGQGVISSIASLGTICQWNLSDGLQKLDKYTYSSSNQIKAGSFLGIGIVSCNVHDETMAAFALLLEHVNDSDKSIQIEAINGLGIALSGSGNEEALKLLLPLVSDLEISIEVSSLAALALGHIFVGTCNGDITSTILQTLLERDYVQLTNKFVKLMSLGLGLLFVGMTEQSDDVLETIEAIEHPISKTLKVLINVCAYAGTGNVLQIQSLLQLCNTKLNFENEKADEPNNDNISEKTTDCNIDSLDANAESTGIEKKTDNKDQEKDESDQIKKNQTNDDSFSNNDDDFYQGIAVLGLACIVLGEDIGQNMSLRHFSHLMHYGNPIIRRAVPLAIGIVSASNPQMKVFETLSRYSHDSDLEVAQNAIYSMGLVGAGTNNSRLDQLLRHLSSYYNKSSDTLFIVKIAQGILHLGKNTSTLNTFNTERSLLSKVSLASLLTISLCLLNPKDFILNTYNDQTSHQLLYYISPAVKPRMLVTIDENLNPIKVNVRVGQAVDVVGQAGKPKNITGWVTQSTPVLLNYGERAELEDNGEWLSLSSFLEGIVILKKKQDCLDKEN